MAVEDPGFDLRGAWTLSTEGLGGRTSSKMLRVEVKSHFSVFFAILIIKLGLK